MATYNGAKHLPEQLESFVQQTRKPDELVAYDDGSSDQTLEILRAFAERAPFPVHVHRNNTNLGFVKNFEKVMLACTGDLIALSDQDDVWLPTKLARHEQVFHLYPRAMVVLNDQAICDEMLRPAGSTVLGNFLAMGLDETSFVAGCCTTIRSAFLDVIAPIPAGTKGHDTWISELATLTSSRHLIRESLQLYRRHTRTVSHSVASQIRSVTPLDLLKAYGLRDARPGWRDDIDVIARYVERLSSLRPALRTLGLDAFAERSLARLARKSECIRRRIEIASVPRWRRSARVLAFWMSGGYDELARWKSAAKDLVRP